MTDLQGHYVGPASGVSFILRIQKRLHHSDQTSSTFTFGDAPLPEFDVAAPSVMLSTEETSRLLQKYFDFTVPMDRFFHRLTLETWLEEFHSTMGAMRRTEDAPARRAVMWMIFAMAQEHMSQEPSSNNDDKRFVSSFCLFTYLQRPSRAQLTEASIRFFLAADLQLSKECGAVSLASVQARLCQCLWLLSQSRMNHCWELFGSAARLALALGLHRRRPTGLGGGHNRIELECCRRTFWNAYCLDNYLSIALGRPRIFHDDDIDQELPSDADDSELSIDQSPRTSHGYSSMLAPVAYFKCKISQKN